ncbi:MAG: hypothetical protein ACKN9D_19180, partial [Actinomycetales bacterium]
WFTGTWGEKVPGSVLFREVQIPRKGGTATLVTVLVPRGAGESVPVVVQDGQVSITRQGATVTVPLPQPS